MAEDVTPENPRQPPQLAPYLWEKGKSGNPAGRPKNVKYISDAYRKILSQKLPPGKDMRTGFKIVLSEMVEKGSTVAEFVAFAQIMEALNGKTNAAQEVTDRIEGKPKQVQEIVGPGEGPLSMVGVDLDRITTDELRTMVKILSKASRDGVAGFTGPDSQSPK